jgi:hypothetical protein
MVDRSDLLAALSDAKAKQEEAQSKASNLSWLELQLAKAQEQINAARQETTALVQEIHSMVPRADLESAKKLIANLEVAAAAENQKQRESVAALNLQLGALEVEKSALQAQIKASFPPCNTQFNSTIRSAADWPLLH